MLRLVTVACLVVAAHALQCTDFNGDSEGCTYTGCSYCWTSAKCAPNYECPDDFSRVWKSNNDCGAGCTCCPSGTAFVTLADAVVTLSYTDCNGAHNYVGTNGAGDFKLESDGDTLSFDNGACSVTYSNVAEDWEGIFAAKTDECIPSDTCCCGTGDATFKDYHKGLLYANTTVTGAACGAASIPRVYGINSATVASVTTADATLTATLKSDHSSIKITQSDNAQCWNVWRSAAALYANTGVWYADESLCTPSDTCCCQTGEGTITRVGRSSFTVESSLSGSICPATEQSITYTLESSKNASFTSEYTTTNGTFNVTLRALLVKPFAIQFTNTLNPKCNSVWRKPTSFFFGTYTLEDQCDTSSCCCSVGEITVNDVGANTVEVVSAVTGTGCPVEGVRKQRYVVSSKTEASLTDGSTVHTATRNGLYLTLTRSDQPTCSQFLASTNYDNTTRWGAARFQVKVLQPAPADDAARDEFWSGFRTDLVGYLGVTIDRISNFSNDADEEDANAFWAVFDIFPGNVNQTKQPTVGETEFKFYAGFIDSTSLLWNRLSFANVDRTVWPSSSYESLVLCDAKTLVSRYDKTKCPGYKPPKEVNNDNIVTSSDEAIVTVCFAVIVPSLLAIGFVFGYLRPVCLLCKKKGTEGGDYTAAPSRLMAGSPAPLSSPQSEPETGV